MNEQEASLIIAHVCSAVKYLHKNGYVHRNLRPETILFESENALSDIKIVDFISCIETKNIKEDDSVFSTLVTSDPNFRAPELLLTKKTYDTKVDVWSCGAILYNMITGIPPYLEKDMESTIEMIKTGKMSCSYPNYEEYSSTELKNLIQSMLVV